MEPSVHYSHSTTSSAEVLIPCLHLGAWQERKRIRHSPVDGGSIRLSSDLICEILIRLPIKSLIQCRCVCKEWWRLISSSAFIAEHSSCTKPLLIASFMDEPGDSDLDSHLSLIDMESGSILKVIKYVRGINLMPTCLDFACVADYQTGIQVVNVTTGAMVLDLTHDDVYDQIMPDDALPDGQMIDPLFPRHFGFGRASMSGTYKVVCLLDNKFHRDIHQQCYVLTLGRDNSSPVWQQKACPPCHVCSCTTCITFIDGTLYFLPNHDTKTPVASDSVIPFDLEDEEWKKVIRGPLSMREQLDHTSSISVTALSGTLSMVHLATHETDLRAATDPHADIWFLADVENNIWVKKYTVKMASSLCNMQVVNILGDGRIVIVNGKRSRLWLYDPRNGSCKEVLDLTEDYGGGISVYTGSLLSSEKYQGYLE
ncbi:unnamed protein product [Urochloa humidicola]